VALNRNATGEPMIQVCLTEVEISEIIRLIDDEEVDESLLSSIRRKLCNRNKRLQRLTRSANPKVVRNA
jgi:DNA-directed RNA polymerase beta' subunit